MTMSYQEEFVAPSTESTPVQRFIPAMPRTFEETGLTHILIKDLIFKVLLTKGVLSGRTLPPRSACTSPSWNRFWPTSRTGFW